LAVSPLTISSRSLRTYSKFSGFLNTLIYEDCLLSTDLNDANGFLYPLLAIEA